LVPVFTVAGLLVADEAIVAKLASAAAASTTTASPGGGRLIGVLPSGAGLREARVRDQGRRPTAILRAGTVRFVTERRSDVVEEVQADVAEPALGVDVELGELAGEDEDAHRDEDAAGDRGDEQVAVADPAERGRRAVAGARGDPGGGGGGRG